MYLMYVGHLVSLTDLINLAGPGNSRLGSSSLLDTSLPSLCERYYDIS